MQASDRNAVCISARRSYRTRRSTELTQPCEGTFHDPAPAPQPATMFCIARCESRQDPATTQGMPNALCIVGAVSQHTIRATARPTTWALEQRKSIEQRESLG